MYLVKRSAVVTPLPTIDRFALGTGVLSSARKKAKRAAR